jgi:hypothetical protein
MQLPVLSFPKAYTLQNTPATSQEDASMKSYSSSIFSTIGSTFPRSRTTSPKKTQQQPLSPQSLWKFANNFFVPWSVPPSEQAEDTETARQTLIEPGTEAEVASQEPENPGASFQPRHQATVEDVPDEDNIDTRDLLEDIQVEHRPDEAHEEEASDSESEDEDDQGTSKVTKKPPPNVTVAGEAYKKLKDIISPPRNKGKGYKDPNLDLLTRSRLEAMKHFLWTFINPQSRSYDQWMAASLNTARAAERGPWFARQLQDWSTAFIADTKVLPENLCIWKLE